MATTYRKNEHGFYVRPPHTLAVLYWLGLLFFSLFISLLATLTGAVALQVFPGCFGFWLLLWWRGRLTISLYESVSLGTSISD